MHEFFESVGDVIGQAGRSVVRALLFGLVLAVLAVCSFNAHGQKLADMTCNAQRETPLLESWRAGFGSAENLRDYLEGKR